LQANSGHVPLAAARMCGQCLSRSSEGASIRSRVTQRAEIQARLVSLGLLGDEPDGELGPNTRAAIRKFQQANGFEEGVYLTAQQHQALTSPTELASPHTPQACPTLLRRPEVQNFAANAFEWAKRNAARTYTDNMIRTILSNFVDYIRDFANMDQRYSTASGRNGSNEIKEAVKRLSPTEFEACFPQVVKFTRDLKQQQDEARVEAAKPINRLRVLYTNYIYLKACYEARLGYLAVWINDVEMDRVKRAVSAIEEKLLSQDSTLNAEDVWNEVKDRRAESVYENQCRLTYNLVMRSAPASPIPKDFGVRD